jgi:hypothetical protein
MTTRPGARAAPVQTITTGEDNSRAVNGLRLQNAVQRCGVTAHPSWSSRARTNRGRRSRPSGSRGAAITGVSAAVTARYSRHLRCAGTSTGRVEGAARDIAEKLTESQRPSSTAFSLAVLTPSQSRALTSSVSDRNVMPCWLRICWADSHQVRYHARDSSENRLALGSSGAQVVFRPRRRPACLRTCRHSGGVCVETEAGPFQPRRLLRCLGWSESSRSQWAHTYPLSLDACPAVAQDGRSTLGPHTSSSTSALRHLGLDRIWS